MKQIFKLTLILVVLTPFLACNNQTDMNKVPGLSSTSDSLNYALGVYIAKKFMDVPDQDEFDLNMVKNGMANVIAGNDSVLTEMEIQQIFKGFSERQQKAYETKLKEDEAAAKVIEDAFLNENKAKEGITVTASGLQYEVIKKGEGGMSPVDTNMVKVHYKGTLTNGDVFDSHMGDDTAKFVLDRVIPGWKEGIPLMQVGDIYKFYVPFDLAYGPQEMGKIKPFSTLIFEVELLDVLPAPKAHNKGRRPNMPVRR